MCAEVCALRSILVLSQLFVFNSERTFPWNLWTRHWLAVWNRARRCRRCITRERFRSRVRKSDAAEEEICGGHMIFAGLGSPIGRASGTGLDRPLTAQDLDRIEHFYRKRNAPSQVDLTPMHPPEVFEMFKERGYAIAELNNVLYRKLERQQKFPAPPAGCEIRRSPAKRPN